jgi:hypothetical protein
MISPRKIKDDEIICNNYSMALGTLKEKLANGEYYTSTNSSVCLTYSRKIHRYKVFSNQDNSVPMDENPRSKEDHDTIRILDIPTSSDDLDKYIESQMELAKLNNILSDRTPDYNDEEQQREFRKELIDNIIHIQKPSVGVKEVAYFEYNNGNSRIAKGCISAITEKYNKEQDQQTIISINNIQRMLSEYDIPNEIAKELAIIILDDKIVNETISFVNTHQH